MPRALLLRASLLRAARLASPAALAALLLAGALVAARPGAAAHAQEAARAQEQEAPARDATGTISEATGGMGVAFGSESTFFHTKLSVPFAVSERLAVGPSVAIFSQLRGEVGSPEDDRFATGLQVQYRLAGRPPASRFRAYAGARGLYSFSEDEGAGLYGGALLGAQYIPTERLAVGLEAQALRGPEEFLFTPNAVVTLFL